MASSAQHLVLEGGDQRVPDSWTGGPGGLSLLPEPVSSPASLCPVSFLPHFQKSSACLGLHPALNLPPDEKCPRSHPAGEQGRHSPWRCSGFLVTGLPCAVPAWSPPRMVRNRRPGQEASSSLSTASSASAVLPPLCAAQLTFMRSRWCSNTLQVVCQVS